VQFFTSPRVNQYLRRLKICCSFIIIFTIIQTYLWYKLKFMEINYNNTLLVFGANTLLIFANLINLFKLMFFTNLIDKKIVDRINCLFYFGFFGFVVNMIETLCTLFGAYLSYFESRINKKINFFKILFLI
jgi:ABC-type bacteriocin/lantibiotic exporter with double-glycine peptidase domain